MIPKISSLDIFLHTSCACETPIVCTSKTGIRLQRSNRILFLEFGHLVCWYTDQVGGKIFKAPSILFRGRREALAKRAKRKSQPVRDDRDDDANPRHLQA